MDRRPSRRRVLAAVGVSFASVGPGCAGLSPGDRRVDTGGRPPDTTAVTQFRGGLERHGANRDVHIPRRPSVEWTVRGVNTGEHTAAKASPVALPNGDVLVAGDTGELQRFTPAGTRVWRTAVEPVTRGIHGTPAIANGTVYIGAYDGAMYAFDLETGDRIWRRKLGDAIGSSPAYYDGTLYIAVEYSGPSGAMFALDAISGETAWVDRRPADHPHSTCAIDREAGRLVVGSNDGNLYGWSFPALEHEWTFETDRPIKGPIATHNGGAFFGSWDRHLYRVDLETGRADWAVETNGLVMSGPAIDDRSDTLYAGSHDSGLYAIDAATGTVQWRFDTRGALIGCPTVTAAHVLVGSYDGHCYAVDRSTGQFGWRVAGVGRVTSTPLAADGAVYFTDRASSASLETGEGPTGGLYKVGSRPTDAASARSADASIVTPS